MNSRTLDCQELQGLQTSELQKSLYPSTDGNIFQSIEFAKILEQLGWRVFVLDFQKKGTKGNIVCHAPANVPVYSGLFPRFEVFYGPAIGGEMDPALLESILGELCKTARTYGSISLLIRTPFPHPYGSNAFHEKGFERRIEGGECSVLIDLEESVDTLWKNMQRFARRCVNKAKNNAIEIKDIETEEELRQFYSIYAQTGGRRGFYPLPFSFFKNTWTQLEPRQLAKFFIAKWKEKTIAGVLNTFYKEESVPYIAGSLNEYWRLSPNHLLFWHSICYSKEVMHSSVFKLYHLPPKRENDKGIDYYSFKTCFGGQLVEECAFYHKTLLPMKFKLYQTCDRVPKSAAIRLVLRLAGIQT